MTRARMSRRQLLGVGMRVFVSRWLGGVTWHRLFPARPPPRRRSLPAPAATAATGAAPVDRGVTSRGGPRGLAGGQRVTGHAASPAGRGVASYEAAAAVVVGPVYGGGGQDQRVERPPRTTWRPARRSAAARSAPSSRTTSSPCCRGSPPVRPRPGYDWLVRWRKGDDGRWGPQPGLAESWELNGQPSRSSCARASSSTTARTVNADAVKCNVDLWMQAPEVDRQDQPPAPSTRTTRLRSWTTTPSRST